MYHGSDRHPELDPRIINSSSFHGPPHRRLSPLKSGLNRPGLFRSQGILSTCLDVLYNARLPRTGGLSACETAKWGGSSAGRASRSQCEGREFDPPPLHQYSRSITSDSYRPCRPFYGKCPSSPLPCVHRLRVSGFHSGFYQVLVAQCLLQLPQHTHHDLLFTFGVIQFCDRLHGEQVNKFIPFPDWQAHDPIRAREGRPTPGYRPGS